MPSRRIRPSTWEKWKEMATEKEKGLCAVNYWATDFRRLTQCMTSPRLSRRGSIPKYLRREFLQLNRWGRRRFSCPSSVNRAAEVRAFERGASSPNLVMRLNLARTGNTAPSGTTWTNAVRYFQLSG